MNNIGSSGIGDGQNTATEVLTASSSQINVGWKKRQEKKGKGDEKGGWERRWEGGGRAEREGGKRREIREKGRGARRGEGGRGIEGKKKKDILPG